MLRASDEEKVRNIVFSILNGYELELDTQGVDADLFDIAEHYKNDIFAVVEHETEGVVGSFALFALDAKELELRKMYLLKEYRGHGLGKWMVEYAQNYAKEKGYSKLSLETASVLVEAEQLYQHMGFTRRISENATPRCNRVYEYKIQ